MDTALLTFNQILEWRGKSTLEFYMQEFIHPPHCISTDHIYIKGNYIFTDKCWNKCHNSDITIHRLLESLEIVSKYFQ